MQETRFGEGAIVGSAGPETPVVAPFAIAILLLEVEDQSREFVVDALAVAEGFGVGGFLCHFTLHGFGIRLKLDDDLYFLQHHGDAEHRAEGDEPVCFFLFAVVECLLLAVQDFPVGFVPQTGEVVF